MDPEEKNMFLGAFLAGVTDIAIETPFQLDPEGMSGVFPYQRPHPLSPPYDDLIAGAVPPALLYLAAKATRKRKFLELAQGAALYGLPMLTEGFVRNIIQMALASPGQFTISHEFPSTNIIRQAKPSPTLSGATEHSGEKLPFQTDMTY